MRRSKSLIARLATVPATFTLMAMTAPSALATDRFVPKSYKTIQAAIDASKDGDNVYVDNGTYHENVNLLGKSIFLVSSGGIIDGDLLGPCVTLDSGNPQAYIVGFRLIDGTGQLDPASGETSGGGIFQTAGYLAINSCVITGCEANRGGGIFVGNGAAAEVNTCQIERCNTSAASNRGGGIAIDDATLYVEGTTIYDCGTTGHTASGGGIHAVGSFLHCGEYRGENLITNNAARFGGGLWLEETYFEVAASIFGNVAKDAGGGAAVFNCQVDFQQSRFVGCEFEYNAADIGSESEGGAIWLSASLVDLEHCELHLNRSKRGGALASMRESYSVIDRCSFRGNSARMGGGIYVNNSRVEAFDSIIAENNCLFRPTLPKDGGGGIFSVDSTFNLEFCTITANRALANASGIYFTGGSFGLGNLERTIVWGNGGPGLARNIDDRSAYRPMQLLECNYETGDDLHPNVNFQVDPLFDPASFVYDLQHSSPLIDICTGGINPLDFDLDPRPHDGDHDGVAAPDCGAQEWQ